MVSQLSYLTDISMVQARRTQHNDAEQDIVLAYLSRSPGQRYFERGKTRLSLEQGEQAEVYNPSRWTLATTWMQDATC